MYIKVSKTVFNTLQKKIFLKHLLSMKNSLNYVNILNKNNATQYNKLQNKLIYDTLIIDISDISYRLHILNSRYRYNTNFIVKIFLITHIETILFKNQVSKKNSTQKLFINVKFILFNKV